MPTIVEELLYKILAELQDTHEALREILQQLKKETK